MITDYGSVTFRMIGSPPTGRRIVIVGYWASVYIAGRLCTRYLTWKSAAIRERIRTGRRPVSGPLSALYLYKWLVRAAPGKNRVRRWYFCHDGFSPRHCRRVMSVKTNRSSGSSYVILFGGFHFRKTDSPLSGTIKNLIDYYSKIDIEPVISCADRAPFAPRENLRVISGRFGAGSYHRAFSQPVTLVIAILRWDPYRNRRVIDIPAPSADPAHA